MSAADAPGSQVHHPAHYNQGDIECKDAIRAALGSAGFIAWCRGNVIKYSWRSGHKSAEEIGQDMKKAAVYAQWAAEEEMRAGKAEVPPTANAAQLPTAAVPLGVVLPGDQAQETLAGGMVPPQKAGFMQCPDPKCRKQVRKTLKGAYPHYRSPGVPCDYAPRGGRMEVGVPPAQLPLGVAKS